MAALLLSAYRALGLVGFFGGLAGTCFLVDAFSM